MSQMQLSFVADEGCGAPKRKRASKPKVKTGCIVCKIRRVKCDETKPACLKCTSTGRKCDGYEQQPGQLAASRKKVKDESPSPVPGQISFNKVAIPRSPSATVMPTDDPAQMSFDFFRLNTPPAIDRESGYRLWTSIVLQLSHNIPAVRLAAAALGTLSRRMQLIDTLRSKKEATGLIYDRVAALSRSAESEYSRALHSLRGHLSKNSDEAAEIGLVSCWLMYAFEFLRGNSKAALVHQVNGMAILQKHLKETDERGSNSRISSIRTQLQKVFDAWDQRTTVWLGLENTLIESIQAVDDPNSIIPVLITLERRTLLPDAGFRDLQDASLGQRQIIISIMFLRHRLSTWLAFESNDNEIELESERQRLLFDISTWRRLFDWYMTENWATLSINDQYWATLLDINGRAANLRLDAILQPSEDAVYAPRGMELNQILSMAESLLYPVNIMKSHDNNFAAITEDQAAAYFNLGLIQPLYHIAVKTTDDTIRARALSLLETEPWEEGGIESAHAAGNARKAASRYDLDYLAGKEEYTQEMEYYHQVHLVPMTC